MTGVYIAFYKGNTDKTGIKALFSLIQDWVVRKVTHGKYSHCEVAIPTTLKGLYCCYSSSARDGGVRMKVMSLPSDKWDLVPINQNPEAVLKLYSHTSQKKYDWLGAACTIFPRSLQFRNRWFCSEWAARVVGLPTPSRYQPNALYSILQYK